MLRSLLLCSLILMMTACGYHREGTQFSSAPKERLYIELFSNETHRAFVNDTLTIQVIERFARSPLFSIIEDPAQADLVLSGAVTLYESNPIAYSSQDAITAYKADLSVKATLRRPHADREILWRQTMTASQDYLVNNPDLVIEQSAERIADDLYTQVTDLIFWGGIPPRP